MTPAPLVISSTVSLLSSPALGSAEQAGGGGGGLGWVGVLISGSSISKDPAASLYHLLLLHRHHCQLVHPLPCQ